jgi:hypothetical protein
MKAAPSRPGRAPSLSAPFLKELGMAPHAAESSSAGPHHWDELIVRFRGQLRGRVRRTLWRAGLRPEREQVEELTQDVCCSLLARERKLGAFRGQTDAEVVAYLGRAAERIVLDQLRAARAQKRGGRATVVPACEATEEIADRAGTPEELLLATEQADRMVARWRDLLAPSDSGDCSDSLQSTEQRDPWETRWERALDRELSPARHEQLLRSARRRLRQWLEDRPQPRERGRQTGMRKRRV